MPLKLLKAGLGVGIILLSSGWAQARTNRQSFVAPNRVDVPHDGEVCFSPDEPCGEKLTAFIATARSSLDIAIYDINLDSFVHEILVLAKRIPVRMVVDRRQSKGSHSAVKLLIKAGIPLKYGHQRGIMHNKFVVLDRKRIETGSFNHTHHAATANHENQIYLSEPSIVSRYSQEFEKLWREGDSPRSSPVP